MRSDGGDNDTPSPAPEDLTGQPVRDLSRMVGGTDRAARRLAAVELERRNDRTAMRPLMTAYMNYGDPEILAALRGYGKELTPAITRDASDISAVGVRRARILDMLAATGDEECSGAVRESLSDPDSEIHVRAAVALAQLGDMGAVDALSDDLSRTDSDRRTLALRALVELDLPQAAAAVERHLDRFLSDTGAIPKDVDVSAPRLANRDVSMTSYLCQHVRNSPHTLTVIIGSEAINMASNRKDAIIADLPGHDVVFSTRRMPPEEQITLLTDARDRAAANPAVKVVVIGALPGPSDSPPVPHFLVHGDAGQYTAKIVVVDPHEVRWVMNWYHYVQDQAEIPTDFEVILVVSTPTASAISEEEFLIHELLPEDRQEDFVRALLARM